ncbi:MAG: hypothetical protein SPL80_07105 [Bacilli bacterium]|nr:hypothetical protein [Bacilli bacterium]
MMHYQKLEKDAASAVFDAFVETGKSFAADDLTDTYKALRKETLKKEAEIHEASYKFDLEMALWFYEYTQQVMQDFTEAVASDNDVWRYICCKVVPEVVERRHGLKDSYFFQRPFRIYFQALWWFVHLSYQGSISSTRKVLENLSTDYIMQFVERSGKDGIYLCVSREIMRQFAMVPIATRNKLVNDKILFRRVMIQNTAKNGSFNLVMEGKEAEYVSLLFEACGVKTI